MYNFFAFLYIVGALAADNYGVDYDADDETGGTLVFVTVDVPTVAPDGELEPRRYTDCVDQLL